MNFDFYRMNGRLDKTIYFVLSSCLWDSYTANGNDMAALVHPAKAHNMLFNPLTLSPIDLDV